MQKSISPLYNVLQECLCCCLHIVYKHLKTQMHIALSKSRFLCKFHIILEIRRKTCKVHQSNLFIMKKQFHTHYFVIAGICYRETHNFMTTHTLCVDIGQYIHAIDDQKSQSVSSVWLVIS